MNSKGTGKIAMGGGTPLQIKEVAITDLKEYENNPRKNEGAVDAVAESIREFGWKVPLVIDKEGVIVAGHTRLKAARRLGLETVPCIVADDLTPEQVKAFRLADNKVSEIAEWDFEILEKELSELSEMDFDMSAFGFDDDGGFGGNDGSAGEDSDAGENYKIVYEIAFNDEDEQSEWYDFLAAIKEEFPECETISERILCAVREWRNEKGN